MSDEELSDTSGSGELKKCVHRIIAVQNLDLSASGLRDGQLLVEGSLIRQRDLRLADIRHNQFAVESFGNGLSQFDHFADIGARRYADKNPLVGAELLLDTVALQIIAKLVIHDVRGEHQRQLPQFR